MESRWSKILNGPENITPWIVFPLAFLSLWYAASQFTVPHQPVVISPPPPILSQPADSSMPEIVAVGSPLPKSNRFAGLQYKTVHIGPPSQYDNVDISYPEFNSTEPAVAHLNEYIHDFVLEDLKKHRDEIARDLLIGEEQDEEDIFGYRSLSLSISYTVYGIVNDIVSIEFIFTDYTWGGNGNHQYPKIVNYDLNADILLSQSDLFCDSEWLTKLSNAAAQEGSFTQMPKTIWDILIFADWAHTGLSEDPENFDKILLEKSGIVIVYPPYEIASGADGILRIKVPYSAVKDFLCFPR